MKRYWAGGHIKKMTGNNIFVFGSNPEGRHGLGAAETAMGFGATYGKGRGLSGNTYALVTKNLKAGFVEKATGIVYEKKGEGSVSLAEIEKNIAELYECANSRPELTFFVVYPYEAWPNGREKTSLNGYTGKQMWDLFTKNLTVPGNIRFHNSFKVLDPDYKNRPISSASPSL